MLYTEITTKCSAAEIAAGDQSAIAAIVNVGRTKVQKVAIADIQAYLQTHGLWLPLKATAANTAHPATTAAQALIEAATARFENIDTTLPIVGQILAGLVATGVFAQADMDAVIAMGTTPDLVTAFQVAQAMENK